MVQPDGKFLEVKEQRANQGNRNIIKLKTQTNMQRTDI